MALLLLASGSYMLYMSIYALHQIISIGYNYGLLNKETISYLKIFKNFHLQILLGLASICSGGLLLFGKRLGWLIALIVLFSNATILLIPRPGKYFHEYYVDKSFFLFGVPLALLFLLAFSILLLKPFRKKYCPIQKTWWTIGAAILIVIIDKTLVFLLS